MKAVESDKKNINSLIAGTASALEYKLQIQRYLSAFPWKYYGKPDPGIPKVGSAPVFKIDHNTINKMKQGLNYLKDIGKAIGISYVIDPAVEHFLNGNYYVAEYTLNNAISQIKNFSKPSKAKHIKGLPPSFKDLLTQRSKTKYPAYFPDSRWAKKNYGTAGAKKCFPWKTDVKGNPILGPDGKLQVADYEDFRACTTPQYNQFLFWGPGVKVGSVGTGMTDPRRARAAALYPNCFSPAAIKKRIQHDMASQPKNWLRSKKEIKTPTSTHSHLFFIPSPGFAPYIEPPKPGPDSIYKNPNDLSKVEAELKIRGRPLFMDKEDEKIYWVLRKYYDKFKKEELSNPLTQQYIDWYHKFYEEHRRRGNTKTKTMTSSYYIDQLEKISNLFYRALR
jgi:hypothetical protein